MYNITTTKTTTKEDVKIVYCIFSYITLFMYRMKY